PDVTLVLGPATLSTFRLTDLGLIGSLGLTQTLGRFRQRLFALLRFGLLLTIGLGVPARDFRLALRALLIELLLPCLLLGRLLVRDFLRLGVLAILLGLRLRGRLRLTAIALALLLERLLLRLRWCLRHLVHRRGLLLRGRLLLRYELLLRYARLPGGGLVRLRRRGARGRGIVVVVTARLRGRRGRTAGRIPRRSDVRRRLRNGLVRRPEIRLHVRWQPFRHARRSATHDLRRDHDDELGLVLLIRAAAEQIPEDRNVADAGDLLHRAVQRVVHQTGNRERLPILQFDFGFRAARRQRRHAEPIERDRVAEIERADLGTDLEVDEIAAKHRRREVQPHAEFLEHDRDGRLAAAAGLHDRIRILAACEEARLFAVQGDQVRLREALEQALGLQRADDRTDVVFRVEQKHVPQVAEPQPSRLSRSAV